MGLPKIQCHLNFLKLQFLQAIFRQAVVAPLMKMPGLDISVPSNFRLISRLPSLFVLENLHVSLTFVGLVLVCDLHVAPPVCQLFFHRPIISSHLLEFKLVSLLCKYLQKSLDLVANYLLIFPLLWPHFQNDQKKSIR